MIKSFLGDAFSMAKSAGDIVNDKARTVADAGTSAIEKGKAAGQAAVGYANAAKDAAGLDLLGLPGLRNQDIPPWRLI